MTEDGETTAQNQPNHYWTERRREIREWLRSEAPPLSELYEGSVVLVFAARFPGAVRFVAHGVREIRNRLLDYLIGRVKRPRIDYVERVSKLEKMWQTAPAVDDEIGQQEDKFHPVIPESDFLRLPREIHREIEKLLADHRQAREYDSDRGARLLKEVNAKKGSRGKVPASAVAAWERATRWAQGKAHDAGDAKFEWDEAKLRQEFTRFEQALWGLVGSFYTTLEEVDEILADTNKSTS